MSDKVAGFYPDPDGENRQRYWDGDAWTEYYTPLAPKAAEVHGSATAAADYPYLAQANHPDVMVAPGATPNAWPTSSTWGPAAQPQGGEDETKVFTSGVRGTPGGMAAVVAVSLLVIMLVVGVGWWLVNGRNPSDPDPTAGPSTSGPQGGGQTNTGSVVVDGNSSGEVPGGGTWVGTLTITEDATYLLDARANDGTLDLELDVRDAGGASLGGNDDRGRDLSELGGVSLDPLAFVTLTAGEYEVVMSEHNGADAGFQLTTTQISDRLELGARASADIPSGGAYYAVVDLPEAGTYTVDVADTEGEDPSLYTFDSDGRFLVNDDRDYDAGDYDPLLEESFAAGPLVVIVTEYFGNATSVDITVTGP
ncbi:DUF2510 domain-containing protein [Occultella gossypii]|uniref:DUF2510 domain-containing protein n=1 Tax=Occultella gossypii TaxID=2800820 RepID=A0ABS7S920_9MICO|nr:DUF2510 domain-containing protein [Occultella gossypii]MBZ2195776.1 DUF2510 domain-containing protein [Occultella gossypii]